MIRIAIVLVFAYLLNACSANPYPANHSVAVSTYGGGYYNTYDPHYSSYYAYDPFINRYPYRYPNYYSTQRHYNKNHKLKNNRKHRVHRTKHRVKHHNRVKNNRVKHGHIVRNNQRVRSHTKHLGTNRNGIKRGNARHNRVKRIKRYRQNQVKSRSVKRSVRNYRNYSYRKSNGSYRKKWIRPRGYKKTKR